MLLTHCVWHRFNVLYTLLYVWCDFKAQKFELLTDPFSFIFERGKIAIAK